MTIDWFTFFAQIINFLILIWLLQRFLYGPIIDAMQQREDRIAAQISEATDAKESSAKVEREYQTKLEQLASTREEMLAATGREVDNWRTEHLQKSKDEVAAARSQWYRSLAREKQSLLRELQLQVAQHATDVSRHLLQDLSDSTLQSRLVNRFLTLLAEADSETQKLIAAAQKTLTLAIETSHELAPPERTHIADEIRRITATDGNIEFRTNAKLVCGIELHAPGCKLAWSVRDALAEVESKLIDAFDEAVPAAEPVPQEITAG